MGCEALWFTRYVPMSGCGLHGPSSTLKIEAMSATVFVNTY